MRINKKSFASRAKQQKLLLLMLFPCVIWVLMFSYGPLWGWYLAFVKYKPGIPILSAPWVGFDNFARFLLKSTDFSRVFRNTISVNLISLAVSTVLEITLAILIHELRFKTFKRIVQTASYLPYFISWVIVGGIFFQFFSMHGIVNNVLIHLGLIENPIMFLGLPSAAWPILVFTRIWKNLGWSTIVYLGAMGAIDPSLYEAAYVDGAGRCKRIWNVTLPGLAPTISVLLILSAGGLINGAFDQVFVFQNSANIDYCDTIDTLIYRTGLMQGSFSYGTAVGMFNNFISITLMLIVNTVVKRINGRSLV